MEMEMELEMDLALAPELALSPDLVITGPPLSSYFSHFAIDNPAASTEPHTPRPARELVTRQAWPPSSVPRSRPSLQTEWLTEKCPQTWRDSPRACKRFVSLQPMRCQAW